MRKSQKTKIDVQGTEVTVRSNQAQDEDFISLTDIARSRETGRPDDLIRNWLRNRSTVEFLGTWERLYNPDFNPVEFDGIKIQTGLNSYSLTPKQWIEKTGAIGTKRLGELQRKIPAASRRVLSVQLNELEAHGIVSKQIYAEQPPKVEYSLTNFGCTLLPIVLALGNWGDENQEFLRGVVEGN